MREYIDSQEDADHVDAALSEIEAHGLDAPVVFRRVEGKLWEIKVSAHRIFYVLVAGPTMVLLHAYRKQSRKAPSREIETASRRMNEVLAG